MTVAPPSFAFLNRTVPDPCVAPKPLPLIVRTLPVPAVMVVGEKSVIAAGALMRSIDAGWAVDGVVVKVLFRYTAGKEKERHTNRSLNHDTSGTDQRRFVRSRHI